ncbi:short-chain dehydrogenase/reductase SDR [Tolumonas auensis DSM 9187]|uniref:Short-chain dehydrogenase/reductase SDR n=1 Tax=Tolumonas auensis (strain DSM 9187 / NBRC 110442 / TA 4) TaxID=595494 RepID=C4LC56_TOLAT|nr:SDR family oxidoreductase [Tolumonas auensis]ACQ92535.1 short-chain dehydrogenase/reductase SDR [Tolumonas auensis DSM 9187]
MSDFILITGCSTGIGLHLAQRLQQEGFNVLATARKENDVNHLLQSGLNAYQLDLNDEKSIEQAVAWALVQSNGQLYGLINNGAYGQTGAIEDLPTQALREQFNTNLFGWHHLTRLILPGMLKENRGRIIQISSLLGLVAMKYRGAYNASKFALEGYTDTLRLELRNTKIQISLVEPGPVSSQFRSNALAKFLQHINVTESRHHDIYQQTLQRLQNPKPKNPFTLGPESCVAPVLHALRSKRAKTRYGVTFPTHLFAVLRRVLPTRWLDSILCRSA